VLPNKDMERTLELTADAHTRRRVTVKDSPTRIVRGLASVLFLFTAENIWIDPWLRNKSHWIPPEALSGAWFSAFAICGVALTLLLVCQILLIRDRALHIWTKMGTGIAVLVVLLLSVQWFRVTNGQSGVPRQRVSGKKHTVTLTWKASSSHVAGYNVYRSVARGDKYLRINSSLVRELTYTDNTVVSGVTYYYVTRAVDDQGHESANSNETSAVIP
jgi:hypothetical protein